MDRDMDALAHLHAPSMIVGNLNVEHVALGKTETDAPLIVDPNRWLTGAISPHFPQPIRGGQAQIPKTSRGIQLQQPHHGPLGDIARQTSGPAGDEKPLRFGIGKRSDHRIVVNKPFMAVKPHAAHFCVAMDAGEGGSGPVGVSGTHARHRTVPVSLRVIDLSVELLHAALPCSEVLSSTTIATPILNPATGAGRNSKQWTRALARQWSRLSFEAGVPRVGQRRVW